MQEAGDSGKGIAKKPNELFSNSGISNSKKTQKQGEKEPVIIQALRNWSQSVKAAPGLVCPAKEKTTSVGEPTWSEERDLASFSIHLISHQLFPLAACTQLMQESTQEG